MNFLTTYDGSMMEGFLPGGWDLARIDACCAHPPGTIEEPQPWWHPEFRPVGCRSVEDFDVMLGHEIAGDDPPDSRRGGAIARPDPARSGRWGMYRWAVYFLQRVADVPCDHVHGFNMDEWSDRDGRTCRPTTPGRSGRAMEGAFYGPLGPGWASRSSRNAGSPRPIACPTTASPDR